MELTLKTSNILKSNLHLVVLVGAANVGKTALVYRYVIDELPPSITSTIGVEFTKKTILDDTGGKLQLHIWDTAGQERYKSVAKHYYRGANACILVYDMSTSSSFQEVPNWLNEIQDNTPPDCTTYLIANKADLMTREITRQQGLDYAKENKLDYLETSAYWPRNTPLNESLAQGVELVFNKMIKKVLAKTIDRPAPQVKLSIKDLYEPSTADNAHASL